MAVPAPFLGSNAVFQPGKGTEDRVSPLVVHRSPGGECISYWKLSDLEIAQIVQSGGVWLSQMTFNHPLQPAAVSGLPMMQLLDETGEIAGAYEPDVPAAEAQVEALPVLQFQGH